MKRIVISVLVAAVSFEILAAQQGTKATSSCASIGYSERCCPPADNCLATDGTTDTVCGCSQACRWFNDCCSDVACPAVPMTCQEAGIYQCCSDRDGQCVVWHPDTNDANGGYTKHCYCDAVCHERNDCCPDVVEIGCKPTCSSTDKQPGCCRWSSTSSCNISFGNYTCYCDSYCVVLGDCCDDVQLPNLFNCPAIPENHNNDGVRSRLHHIGQKVKTLRYLLKHSGTPAVATYLGYDDQLRLAVTARAERVRASAGEFRGRARARVAASPPTRARHNYNYNY